MTINYIPNDPLAQGDIPMRIHTARPDRPAGRAGFSYVGLSPEDRYPIGTPEFLFWQCSESALATLEMWEDLNGNLGRWARQRRTLKLRQNAGRDLNAFYDRSSFSFFEYTTGGKTTYSGASTDVVAHEVGHGLLDAIRPDLWNSFLTETNAFHEAFGDCIAVLTALHDRRSRDALLDDVPDLWSEHFLEATAEDLSDGIRRAAGAAHPAAAPRHAYNWLSWQLPTSLPTSGGPNTLTSEIHSFGRVFSGCFYDTIGLIFNSRQQRTQRALWNAARTAGRLLIAAAETAPETPRFFQAVGRAMILADEQQNGGANHTAIRDAFQYHNISLGSSAMLAPSVALSGTGPRFAASGRRATLSTSTKRDLLRRIGAGAGEGIRVQATRMGNRQVAQAIHQRDVSLGGVDSRLQGVVAVAAEPILIGGSGGAAAVLGSLPQQEQTKEEVGQFVKMLVDHHCIEFKKSGRRAARAADERTPTHAIRSVHGKRVLTRVRMMCRAFRSEGER